MSDGVAEAKNLQQYSIDSDWVDQSKLIDNNAQTENYLFRYLNTLLPLKRQNGAYRFTRLRIVTGYLDLKGVQKILVELEKFLQRDETSLEILLGKEPSLYTSQMKPEQRPPADEKFPDFYIQQDLEKLDEAFRPAAQLLADYTNFDTASGSDESSKIKIRVFGEKDGEIIEFLHAKAYIFVDPNRQLEGSKAIVGSANFTGSGLDKNQELCYLFTEGKKIFDPEHPEDIRTLNGWFEEKWQRSRPWTGEFRVLLKNSPIGKKLTAKKSAVSSVAATASLTPYELYIKLLQSEYDDIVDSQTSNVVESYIPKEYAHYQFQIDAVKVCYQKMLARDGFLLSDVVGLGKTIVGTMVIKHFLTDIRHERPRKVLVIAPPAIKREWEKTIADFDHESADKIADKITIISTGIVQDFTGYEAPAVDENDSSDEDAHDSGELNADIDMQTDYGLILIDESHKFRNNDTDMYQALDEYISMTEQRVGVNPYIGLLSATPQNNTPEDIKNQILLFARKPRKSKFTQAAGGDLEAFFGNAETGITTRYRAIRSEMNELGKSKKPNKAKKAKLLYELKELSVELREKILKDIMVRRTRTDIDKYYPEDKEQGGLVFPAVQDPVTLEYAMDPALARAFAKTMDSINAEDDFDFDDPRYLCYARYQAIRYLKEENNRRLYEGKNRSVTDVSKQLARLMQMQLVKRLESSFAAFTASLNNLRQNTENMLEMWKKKAIFICPDIDVNAEFETLGSDKAIASLRQKITKLNTSGRNEKGKNSEYKPSDFSPEYKERLDSDYKLISSLCKKWDKITHDPKLDVFMENLESVILDPNRNPNKKLVIFTEAKDTLDLLKNKLSQKGFADRTLAVSAGNRDNLQETIRQNFDANYTGEQKNDYDIIITTEVLAEGVNLHRANSILNYDTPWNSTRLIQRIGRVNRIGSKSENIYVYNFMPSTEGNQLIQLLEKANIKLQSFHTLFGEDNKVLSPEEQLSHYDSGKEITDLMNGEESPYEKYVRELKDYKKEHPERYEEIKAVTTNLEMAVGNTGQALFLFHAGKNSRFCVQTGNDEKGCIQGRIISLLEMFTGFRTDPAAQSVPQPLPEVWNSTKCAAKNAVLRHLNPKLDKPQKMGNINHALNYIKDIQHCLSAEGQLDEASSYLLDEVDELCRCGHKPVVDTLLALRNKSGSPTLPGFKTFDIKSKLSAALGKVVAHTKQEYGDPVVYLGLAK